MHNKGKCHVFFLARGGKNKVTKRQECQQRHIVGNEHGADEGNIHQGQNTEPGIAEALNDPLGQDVEKANILQSADHRQHAKQTSQGLYIEISQISLIHRHEYRCHHRRGERNEHNRIGFHKIKGFMYRMKKDAESRAHPPDRTGTALGLDRMTLHGIHLVTNTKFCRKAQHNHRL